MARTDWVALTCQPMGEYLALTELMRFQLRPFMPQIRRRWRTPSRDAYLIRCFPMFPRYLLLPIADARPQIFRLVRGLVRTRPVLAYDDGTLWRAPHDVIDAIRAAEARGDFDEAETPSPGTSVRLNGGALSDVVATLERSNPRTVELFAPLLGGVRVKTSPDRIAVRV